MADYGRTTRLEGQRARPRGGPQVKVWRNPKSEHKALPEGVRSRIIQKRTDFGKIGTGNRSPAPTPATPGATRAMPSERDSLRYIQTLTLDRRAPSLVREKLARLQDQLQKGIECGNSHKVMTPAEVSRLGRLGVDRNPLRLMMPKYDFQTGSTNFRTAHEFDGKFYVREHFGGVDRWLAIYPKAGGVP